MQARAEKLLIGLVFLYHFLYAVAFFETIGIFLNPIRARAISLGLIMLLAFVMYTPTKNKLLLGLYRGFCILATVIITAYLVLAYDSFKFRIGSAVGYEVILGILAIFIVLESTRFTAGKEISVVAVIFILYAIFGRYLPGFFQAPPASIALVSGQTYLGLMGIYGLSIGIILDYVFGFLVFGFVLGHVGGIRFFIDLAFRVFGNRRGGSAQIAVATNQFFGMVSGSTLAAILVTGPLTIPRMRRDGYSERFMGGLIAAAADAAQLAPPVMGLVAFFMAAYLQLPYIDIVIAATFPALFYYISLYLSCYVLAVKRDLRPAPRSTEQLLPLWKLFIKNWHTVGASAVLITLLATEVTSARISIMISTALLLVGGSLRRETRPTLKDLQGTMVDAAKGLVEIGPVCAAAGIIIAVVGMTTLDYKFSAEITDIAGQNVLLLLVLASIACFVLGMGMPTLPAYILVVLLVAPTLTSLGLPPIAVHMFIFYQTLTAMVTPPVCLNVFAVAPMVKSTIWKIGISATVIGAARYVIPFLFVYRPGLLMIGSAKEILIDLLIACVVVLAVTFAQNMYGFTRARWWEIFSALLGALLLFYPMPEFLIAGSLLLILTLGSQVLRFFRAAPRPSTV